MADSLKSIAGITRLDASPSARDRFEARHGTVRTRSRSGCCSRQNADLDVHAGRQAEALVERLDGLAGRLQDVDQTLVRPDLELLARLPVDVRAAEHRVAL